METHEVLNEVTSGLGPELTRWTARAAAGCWVFWLLIVVAGVSGRSRRVVWTAGLVAHLAKWFVPSISFTTGATRRRCCTRPG